MTLQIEKLRMKIDEIDQKIEDLINSRGKIAIEVSQVKKAHNQLDTFYRPEREARILRQVTNRNAGVLKKKDMAHIFREIMSACLAIEKPHKVAYLGPEGTYTQEAAFKHFGHAVSSLDCARIPEIFDQVEKGNADYGVVPIENSSNGIIGASVDMLYSHNLKICGEVETAIQHQLMAANLDSAIHTIYAHQQAFDQCQRWLFNHYPNVELQPVSSNAQAARIVSTEEGSAAIASEAALGFYNLVRLAQNIEDKTGNTTRFLVLGKALITPSGDDKTTFLALTRHEPGALFDLLEPFKKNKINILQLARHPVPGVKWEYLFLIDIEGHQEDRNIAEALSMVRERALQLSVLGSYPCAVI